MSNADIVSILREIPTAYVRLHVAITGPRKQGSGVKVSGGAKNYVPLNVEAEDQKLKLWVAVMEVHGIVAEAFSELPATGIQDACNDLLKWVDIWVHLPNGDDLVALLATQLRRSNNITGHSEEPTRLPQTVCPNCLAVGGMYLSDGIGEDEKYGCDGCGISLSPGEYAQAVREALTKHRPAA